MAAWRNTALSHRLPAFLDRYGPAQGYAVVVAAREALALRPGLLRLYEAAIQAGRKPDEVGLPPFTGWERDMHFQARLLDPTGRRGGGGGGGRQAGRAVQGSRDR